MAVPLSGRGQLFFRTVTVAMAVPLSGKGKHFFRAVGMAVPLRGRAGGSSDQKGWQFL